MHYVSVMLCNLILKNYLRKMHDLMKINITSHIFDIWVNRRENCTNSNHWKISYLHLNQPTRFTIVSNLHLMFKWRLSRATSIVIDSERSQKLRWKNIWGKMKCSLQMTDIYIYIYSIEIIISKTSKKWNIY